MAAIPVTIQGVLFYSDVGVGGGPAPGGPPVIPSHPIVIPPDAIAPGVPTHPIVIPQPPLGFWGGVAPPIPTHPIAPGGPPPSIWPSPGVPTHPIAPGGPPPGIWGGAPPYIDIGGPAPQPRPEHPIVLPPDLPPSLPDPDNRLIEWKTAWTPQSGWVVVGIPQVPAPTPSA